MDKEIEAKARDAAREALREFERENAVPTILLCGKTGAGKSSLMNAVAGAAVQEVGVVPTTQTPSNVALDRGEMGSLRAIDVAGFGEANRHRERVDTILKVAEQCHLGLLVIGFPDRSLEMEVDFLSEMRRASGGPSLRIPMIVAANKVDLAPPRAEWSPRELNLTGPSTGKERAIVNWLHYVTSTTEREARIVSVPCAAGEFWNDASNQFGIGALKSALYQALPEGARTLFARIIRDEAIRDRRAQAVILGASVAAAGIALQPVAAIPDAALIAPIQVMMIIGLAKLYGGDPNEVDAGRLIGPALATAGGRILFEQLVKLIPGVGSILGAAVAGTITLSLGEVYHFLIKKGIWEPSREQMVMAFKSAWARNKDLSLDEIRRRREAAN